MFSLLFSFTIFSCIFLLFSSFPSTLFSHFFLFNLICSIKFHLHPPLLSSIHISFSPFSPSLLFTSLQSLLKFSLLFFFLPFYLLLSITYLISSPLLSSRLLSSPLVSSPLVHTSGSSLQPQSVPDPWTLPQ